MKTIEELRTEYKACLATQNSLRKALEDAITVCFRKEVEYRFAYIQQLATKQDIFIRYGNLNVIEKVIPIAPVKVPHVGIYSPPTKKLKVKVVKTGAIRIVSFYDLYDENRRLILPD